MKEALTGLARAIVILAVLLVIMNVVKTVIYKDDMNKEEQEVNVVEPGDDQGKVTQEKTKYDDKYDYKSLFDKYDFKMIQENFGSDLKDEYFSQGFTNKLYLFLSTISTTKNTFMLHCNNTQTITEENMNSKIKELFGNVEYTPTSYENNDKTFTVTYDETKRVYTVVNKKCSGIDTTKGYVDTIFLGGKTTDNTLEVYETAHYINYENDNGLLKVVHHKDVLSNSEAVKDPNANNVFATYKLVFTKLESGVVLNKVEKVN